MLKLILLKLVAIVSRYYPTKKQIKNVIMMKETQGENLCPKKRKY